MKSDVTKYNASPYWGYVAIGCIATAVAVIVFGFSHYTIPTFKELFHGFGAELPALTQFFLTYYKFYLVVPILLVVLTICLSIPDLANKNTRFTLFIVAIMSLILSCAYGVLLILAMYMPVNALGSL